jgi:predicted NAD/FAD-binding protein
VQGGGRVYVEKIAAQLADVRIATPVRRIVRGAAGVDVIAAAGAAERFDDVVLACHSDQALALLGDASPGERRLLSQVRYQANRVVLHTDASLLPRSRRTWSAWNCLVVDDRSGTRPVAVSYLINKLQPLPCKTPVIVTLNPPVEPEAARVLREFEYAHPLLDGHALAARNEFAPLQGRRRTWYAGAWLGYGFHEDGLTSAHAVAEGIARREADLRPLRMRAAA